MIKEQLQELLRVKFPGFDPAAQFCEQMNSLQLVELVKEIEAGFGIEIQSIEIDDENFRNLDSIGQLIARKRS